MSVPTADHASTSMLPVSRLRPAPWNPRLIREPRFVALCKSLQVDPAFLWDRPILATPDGTVFAGNMRLRAALHLGWSAVPARLVDISEDEAKARALRDNNPAGEWQEDDLAALVYGLGETGADLDALGFDQENLARLLDSTGANGEAPAYGDQPDPTLASESLIEIRCSRADLMAFHPTLSEWMGRDGVTINIS